MSDRSTVLIPLVVVAVVLLVVVFVVIQPTEQTPLRTAAVHTVPAPTPDLPATPWREAFLDVELAPPEPEPESEQVAEAPSPTAVAVLPTPGPTLHPRGRLAQKLLGMVYINYIQVGDVKRGSIQNTLKNDLYSVFEGYKLPGGIVVDTLSPLTAVVRLEDATYELKLVKRPDFLDNPNLATLMPTAEQQELARDWYEAQYGDFLREQAKDYKPLTGVPVPKRLSPEETEQRRKEHMEKWGKQFGLDSQKAQELHEKHYDPEVQRQAFLKYWEQFHPGKELPSPEAR